MPSLVIRYRQEPTNGSLFLSVLFELKMPIELGKLYLNLSPRKFIEETESAAELTVQQSNNVQSKGSFQIEIFNEDDQQVEVLNEWCLKTKNQLNQRLSSFGINLNNKCFVQVAFWSEDRAATQLSFSLQLFISKRISILFTLTL